MTLSTCVAEYIAACFTGIWVQSHEHQDAIIEIARLCKDHNWSLATWDIDRGLQANGQAAAGTSDPLAAIKAIGSLAKPEISALLVLPNFHQFLQSTEVIQALAHQIQAGKTSRTFIINRNMDGNWCDNEVECPDCGAEWKDVYFLGDVQVTKEPERR